MVEGVSEQRVCHGCGRTDGLHASASWRGETRYFCHDDERSCYNEWRGRYFAEEQPVGSPSLLSRAHGVVCRILGHNSSCEWWQK
jgi:hypothetical protein